MPGKSTNFFIFSFFPKKKPWNNNILNNEDVYKIKKKGRKNGRARSSSGKRWSNRLWYNMEKLSLYVSAMIIHWHGNEKNQTCCSGVRSFRPLATWYFFSAFIAVHQIQHLFFNAKPDLTSGILISFYFLKGWFFFFGKIFNIFLPSFRIYKKKISYLYKQPWSNKS